MIELAKSPSLPDCPIPYGLMSLWDMMKFRANEFIGALQALRGVEILVEQNVGTPTVRLNLEAAESVHVKLNELERTCEEIGAVITADFVRDGLRVLHQGEMTWSCLADASKQIHMVLEKELRRAKLFTMSPAKIVYFEKAIDRFEIETLQSFGSAMDDVDEAGKCFALGRHTACVFHLMRVLERPISGMAKVLLPNDPLPNWGTVLKKNRY